MATRTENRSSNRKSNRNKGSDSAFSWGKKNAGALAGAALAGAALGFAANFGRKFVMQGMSGMAGDWDEVLAAEHKMALAIFDKMLATDSDQSFKRSALLVKLTHALDKHAHEEEMVIYPALREANIAHDADSLEAEHGYVKTYLYELSKMESDAPNWLEKVRQFRQLVASHARMEEDEIFPKFKQGLSEEQNYELTTMVNRDGFRMA